MVCTWLFAPFRSKIQGKTARKIDTWKQNPCIAETAKANSLKPYDYFEYLLIEIPKHLDDTDCGFLDDLLPWSPNPPANCRKPGKDEVK